MNPTNVQQTLQQLIQSIKNGDAQSFEYAIRDFPDKPRLFETRIDDAHPTNHCFGHNTTILQFASFRQWKLDTAAETLIAHGAMIDLHSACGLEKVDVISDIVDADASQLDLAVGGFYPIQYSIAGKRPNSVRTLLELGDNPNRPIQKLGWYAWEDEVLTSQPVEWRPIHMSAVWGFPRGVEIAKTLKQAGADINCDTPLDGYRPIHLSATQNLTPLIRFLVSTGIDVNERTSDRNEICIEGDILPPPHGGHNWTPLMVAAGEGFVESIKCLLELNADQQCRNSVGRTALHIAAGGFWHERQDIYRQIVCLLLDHGADVNATDKHGNRPIDFAKSKNYHSIIDLLE